MTTSAAPGLPSVRLARALGGLLVIAGLSAILALFVSIAVHPDVRTALDTTLGPDRPSLVLAVLDRFGLLVPGLVFGLGAGSVGLGVRVAQRGAGAIRMARDLALWATLFSVGLAVVRVARGVPWWPVGEPSAVGGAAFGEFASGTAAAVALALLAILARVGLARLARDPTLPTEPLTARETRGAWNLLLPALLILVMVAARPLEATVVTSLTDKRFASSAVPQFVGLQNYRELLTVRIDELECRREDDGSCALNRDGEVRWNTLPVEALREGYRTAYVWNLPFVTAPDTALSLSALDEQWVRSIWVTVVFTVLSVSGELLLGLFIALTVHSSFRGRGAMRAVMLIPWAIPTVVSARLWELMLDDTRAGVLNQALLSLGFIDAPLAWLTDPSLQLPSVILIDVWKTAPFMALLLLAGLQVIPKELYESARVDGASPFREFFAITLPLLRPAIGVALIFRTLDALRVFDLFQVLLGRAQQSMSTYNFDVLINNQQAGYASAIGVLIFLLIFVFAVAYVRVLGVNRE